MRSIKALQKLYKYLVRKYEKESTDSSNAVQLDINDKILTSPEMKDFIEKNYEGNISSAQLTEMVIIFDEKHNEVVPTSSTHKFWVSYLGVVNSTPEVSDRYKILEEYIPKYIPEYTSKYDSVSINDSNFRCMAYDDDIFALSKDERVYIFHATKVIALFKGVALKMAKYVILNESKLATATAACFDPITAVVVQGFISIATEAKEALNVFKAFNDLAAKLDLVVPPQNLYLFFSMTLASGYLESTCEAARACDFIANTQRSIAEFSRGVLVLTSKVNSIIGNDANLTLDKNLFAGEMTSKKLIESIRYNLFDVKIIDCKVGESLNADGSKDFNVAVEVDSSCDVKDPFRLGLVFGDLFYKGIYSDIDEDESLSFGYDSDSLFLGCDTGLLPFGHDSDSLPLGHDSDSLPLGHDSDSLPLGHNSGSLPGGPGSNSLCFGHDSDSLPFGHDSNSFPGGPGSNSLPAAPKS